MKERSEEETREGKGRAVLATATVVSPNELLVAPIARSDPTANPTNRCPFLTLMRTSQMLSGLELNSMFRSGPVRPAV